MLEIELPELPPRGYGNDGWCADDVREYARGVALAERERIARFVEDGYVRQFTRPWREDLAEAIRAPQGGPRG